MKFTHSAHLCMIMKVNDGIPCFTGVQIYSAPPHGLTARSNELFTLVYSAEADSFQAAQDKIMRLVMGAEGDKDPPPFAWARSWLDKSLQGHQGRLFFSELFR